MKKANTGKMKATKKMTKKTVKKGKKFNAKAYGKAHASYFGTAKAEDMGKK
jgi:hypothetical protein